MLHNGEEQKKFDKLSMEYMSEESDPDDNVIVSVHRPVWRSSSKFKHFYWWIL